MDVDERIRALEDDFRVEKEEIRQILLDIRTSLMEANTPLRTESGFVSASTQDD